MRTDFRPTGQTSFYTTDNANMILLRKQRHSMCTIVMGYTIISTALYDISN